MASASDINVAVGGYAVSPHDSTNFATPFRALWVGVLGNVVVVGLDNSVVTYVGVQGLLPTAGKRVNSTGTTATSIVGMV